MKNRWSSQAGSSFILHRSSPLTRRPRCRASYRFYGDRGQGRSIIEVDVAHVIVRIMVASAVNVVVFHEQDDWDSGVGKDLAVCVVKGAARIVGQAYFTA